MSEQLKNQSIFNEKLHKIMGDEGVLLQEPLKKYTSFKIGGPCDYFVMPKSVEEFQKVVSLCYESDVDLFVLGNGSNLLVTDKGYRGLVIQIFNRFNDIKVDGRTIVAKTGVSLAALSAAAAKESLSGLEFASGIPGTLGGAVYMNAGAYGGEMKQVVTSVRAIDMQGNLKVFNQEELDFSYRHSGLQKDGYIALEVTMELEKGQQKDIKSMMLELNMRRKDKQPLELPSAGSTFKRPEGYYAGKLIMDAGLRGYHIGDAMVSEKHCGFVVNSGQASFEEVYQLIQYIQKEVKEQFDVTLEREVKIIGEM